MPTRIGVVLLSFALLNGQIPPQQLTSESPSLRQAALQQLAALSAPEKTRYLPQLVGLLRGKEANRSVLAFAKIGPPAAPTLMNLLDDPDRLVRGFAAKAIATIRLAAPEVIAKLRLMLKDKDTWVQQLAAESLLSIGIADKGAQSIVREQWKSAGYQVIGSKPSGTISDWLHLLSNDDPVVVHNAVSSLMEAGAAAVPRLIAALKSHDPNIRIGAAETLEMMHLCRPDIEAACIQALQDPTARVREFARSILLFQVSEAAMDALLQDDIAEIARKQARELRAQKERAQPHTLAQVLAAIPSDPDNKYRLEVSDQFETKSPDGTVLLTVLRTGKKRGDLLRVWRLQQAAYYLAKEDNGEPAIHLSANGFHYKGKAYLHMMRLSEGTGYRHEDEIFRIESGGLTKLTAPKGLPLVLAHGEGVWKGFVETFEDDDLEFKFGIWKDGDGNCCPTAGWIKGTYTIAGDELKYATWKRLKEYPR